MISSAMASRTCLLVIPLLVVGLISSCSKKSKGPDQPQSASAQAQPSPATSVPRTVKFPNFCTLQLEGYAPSQINESVKYDGPKGLPTITVRIQTNSGVHTVSNKDQPNGQLLVDDEVLACGLLRILAPWDIQPQAKGRASNSLAEGLRSIGG